MTTARANQRCVGCGSLLNYEGHDDRKTALTHHRFHCHSCGKVFVLQSTSHKMPTFAVKEHHLSDEEGEAPH